MNRAVWEPRLQRLWYGNSKLAAVLLPLSGRLAEPAAAVRDGLLPRRVAHGDTKLNNVLFDSETGATVCVVDLDTCMPGAVLPDFGDLVRTCCSPEPEDSTRLDAVVARPDVYRSLLRGYTEGWGGALSRAELEALPEAGRMMSFVLGLRMLTDHLDGDRYFSVSHPNHNLDRARNQFRLHESLDELSVGAT